MLPHHAQLRRHVQDGKARSEGDQAAQRWCEGELVHLAPMRDRGSAAAHTIRIAALAHITHQTPDAQHNKMSILFPLTRSAPYAACCAASDCISNRRVMPQRHITDEVVQSRLLVELRELQEEDSSRKAVTKVRPMTWLRV